MQYYKVNELENSIIANPTSLIFVGLSTAILFCVIFLVCSKHSDRKAKTRLDMEQYIINEHMNDDDSSQRSSNLQDWCNEDNSNISSINSYSNSQKQDSSQNHVNSINSMMQDLLR